jgi:hypothetical protein
MKKLLLFPVLFLCSSTLFSQEGVISSTDTLRKHAINVYMDNVPDYVKKEIPFLNYVRDKKVADLIIIETMQRTGSGGSELTLYIEGQFDFAGVMDTIKFAFYPDETEDQMRARAVRTFKMGLVKYIIDTPLAEFIDITFTEPITEEVSSDRWNNWVFRTRLSTNLNGQKTSNSRSIGTLLNAGRTTSEWKLNVGLIYDHSQTKYDYGDIKATNTKKSSRIWGDAVKSINDHWSVGLSADAYSSIYSNYDLALSLEPAIEYDIFPYSESTRRIFRIFYIASFKYNDYSDTTQFFKTEETLWSHRIQTSFTTVQKWGEVYFYAGWSNYLHDFSLNNLTFNSSINLRIAKGLSVNAAAFYSFIHDQVSLRKGDASVEDVLLQRQELSTSFSYRIRFGITYTFGSIYSNVVNPRLNNIF